MDADGAQIVRRRYWRWAGLVVGVLLIGAILGAWLTFQHIPAWYQPMVVPAAQLDEVRNDLLRAQDSFTMTLREGRRFTYRITDDQLNALYAARDEVWRQARDWRLPRGLSDPCLAFDDGIIRFGATYQGAGVRTVLSASLSVTAEPDGLEVRLESVNAGSLPVPTSWIEDQLRAVSRGWPAGRVVPGQVDDRPLPALEDLPFGAVFPDSWVWVNGKQPFRIADVKVERGAMVLSIEPIARRVR